MILKRARVTNFRCVDDSGWFRIDPVTCLVGKNESGKTAILLALEKINAIEERRGKFDRYPDYPRKWITEYDERNPDKAPVAVRTVWEINDAELGLVEKELGANSLRSREIEIAKDFSNISTWSVDLDYKVVFKHLAQAAGCKPDQVEAISHLQSMKNLKGYIEANSSEEATGLKNLAATMAKYRNGSVLSHAVDILSPHLPKFLYFSTYDRMPGKVSISDLIQRQESNRLQDGHRLFLDFLDFARITLADIKDATKSEELRAKCEGASITITRQIFEYWSQNKDLKAEFIVEAGRRDDEPPFNEGFVMEARIRNALHDMTVPFGERSAGFVWFFSFLVHFSQVKKQQGSVIILLDEPGLALHAKAQSDLLRYFNDKLRPSHQLIYTTHSPFMVPPTDVTSVRTVEDVVETSNGLRRSVGTHVGDESLSRDRDTLFPLQAALGYEITQTLFVGEHTLIVEGVSDYLYFVAFSELLKQRGRVSLDDRWTICPSGGVDKVPAFISLFGGNSLDIAVVIDYVKGQKKKVEDLQQNGLLKDGRVLTFAEFTDQDEADVEDMLGVDLYLQIVNDAYALKGKDRLSKSKLETGERVLPRVEAAMRIAPLEAGDFNHFKPARYLFENLSAAGTTHLDPALDRFEKLFTALNGML